MRTEVPPAIRALGPAVEQPAAPTRRYTEDHEVGELLPCPFCGREPTFVEGEDGDGRFVAVGCEGCGAGSRQHYHVKEDARPFAASAWNTRRLAAPPALPPDLRERVVDVLEFYADPRAYIEKDDGDGAFQAEIGVPDFYAEMDFGSRAVAIVSALREPPEWLPTHQGDLAALRSAGWSVAVHNDYRQDGQPHTFWLLTHPNGRWIKGEGRTDDEALCAASAEARVAMEAGR